MKKSVVSIIVLVVLVIALIAVFSNKDSVQGVRKGEPVKIGVIAPLSGDAAVYGESARNVYQIAVEEINAAGGIDGSPIELVFADGQCSGTGAANAAQKLVNVDKLQVIIGGFCSAESLSALPIAEAGKVALFSPASSNPSLTNKSPYFFRNFPSDSSQGSVLAQLAYDQGKRKVAFISEQTDYTAGIATAFADKFKSLGGEIVEEKYAPESKDFRSNLTKLKAENPDALFINANTPAAVEIITQQFGVLDWDVQLFTNDIILGATDVLAKYSDTLEGMIGAQFGVDPNNAKFKHIAEAYKAKHGVEMPYQSYGQTEYDAVYILKDAISAVGYDGTKIAEYGHKINNWQGAAGSITIGSDGDLKGGHGPYVVKDGKVEAYKK